MTPLAEIGSLVCCDAQHSSREMMLKGAKCASSAKRGAHEPSRVEGRPEPPFRLFQCALNHRHSMAAHGPSIQLDQK